MNLPDKPLDNDEIRLHFYSFLMATFPDAPMAYLEDLIDRCKVGRVAKDEWAAMLLALDTHPDYRTPTE